MTQHTIFVFNNGGSHGFMSAVALGDDGVLVAGHCCSHEGWMKHDMGLTSDWKHEEYNAQYGEGNWKLEWIETDGLKEHAGLNAAIKLHESLNPQT